MTAIATPTLDDQVLEDLDFDLALPCESNLHDHIGSTELPEWVVTGRPLCGCPEWKILCCDPCLTVGLSDTQVHEFRHDICGKTFTCSYADTIIATERIR